MIIKKYEFLNMDIKNINIILNMVMKNMNIILNIIIKKNIDIILNMDINIKKYRYNF